MQIVELVQASPLVPGVADHQFHLVSTSLQPHGLHTVVGTPHGPGQLVEADSERFGNGFERQCHFPLARTAAVADVVHPVVGSQFLLDLIGDRFDFVDVMAQQVQFDGPPTGGVVDAPEDDPLGAWEISGTLAPLGNHLAARFLCEELSRFEADVDLAPHVVQLVVVPDAPETGLDQRLSIPVVAAKVLFLDLTERLLQSLGGGIDRGRRCALGVFDVGVEERPVEIRFCDEGGESAVEEAGGDQQGRERSGQQDSRVSQGPPEHGGVNTVDEAVDRPLYRPLKTGHVLGETWQPRPSKMTGKNEQPLCQRDQQHRGQPQGHHADLLARLAADVGQRQEGDHAGQHAVDHRRGDFDCAVNGCLESAATA